MSTKHVVKVTIAGDEYPIRSDASPEHTRAVASYLDKAIQRITSGGPVMDAHKAAILAALQITDELFQARESTNQINTGIRSLSADIKRLLPPQKRGEARSG